MSTRNRRSAAGTPATPRVISPSPTPSELQDAQDAAYFGPTTRSAARKRMSTPQPVQENIDEESDEADDSEPSDLRRARTRSRSPIELRNRVKPMTKRNSSKSSNVVLPSEPITADSPSTAANGNVNGNVNGNANANANGKSPQTNGHLTVPSGSSGGWSWRDFSRSPSPLGLIPIHRKWRTFVHKHEVPRKVLHVSIGFVVVWLYLAGVRTFNVAPYLMAGLVPIAATDWLRHKHAGFNRFYVSVLGALMRESEYAGWNGVVFYLLGAWIVLYFFPKDVGVMGILLLSWCDTAASTFGRLYGRYTPRIRKGKSLAGSTAAFLVGIATSVFWYGWLVPRYGPMPGDDGFMFKGLLRLPAAVASAVGFEDASQASIGGSLALGVVSVWSGLAAAASEVVDLFGWDDNLTIPVLSGAGIWGFLKIFG